MDTKNNDYHISFFKPSTHQAKANRNMVVVLVLIWAFGVFGFQIWLRVAEKPTPELAFKSYEQAWPSVEKGTASKDELQEFAKSAMSVLGKHFVKPEQKAALENGVSWAVFQLVADTLKTGFMDKLVAFEKVESEISDITDPNYLAQKMAFISYLRPLVGFEENDVRATLLPLNLNSADLTKFRNESKELVPTAMSTYLIHNQSFLTDSKFLGFPFHYFYTAVFLLILFVLLCLAYCVRTDNYNKRYSIAD